MRCINVWKWRIFLYQFLLKVFEELVLVYCSVVLMGSSPPPWVLMAALGMKTSSMTISKQCWTWVTESKAMLSTWYSKLCPGGILELREISKNWRRCSVEVSCRSKYDQKKHSSALSVDSPLLHQVFRRQCVTNVFRCVRVQVTTSSQSTSDLSTSFWQKSIEDFPCCQV